MRNADMILEEGAGIKISDSRMLSYKIQKVLRDRKKLKSMQKNAKRIGSTNATEKIAKYVLEGEYMNKKSN